MEIKDIFLT